MFSKATFNFLVDISLSNNREWFDANRDRYETEVRAPALAFIRAMAPRLAAISPHFVASDKKVGGSLMRIFRDTRFSNDKTPYKTNVGIQFRHEAGKDVHAPGYYVHVDPDGCFVGVGLWGPDAPTLAAIRQRIDAAPREYLAARDDAAFEARFELGDHGESLKTAPRGYAKDHPLIDDLKRKHHIASASLEPEQLFGAEGVDTVAELFEVATPFMRFMTRAAGQKF